MFKFVCACFDLVHVKRINRLKKNTISEFTRTATNYDIDDNMYCSVKEDYFDVIKEIEREEFSALLDCGCGTGKLIELLSKRHCDARYIGIDITPIMINEAKKKNINNAEFSIGDVSDIWWDGEKFDVITCVHSFHHYTDVDAFLENAGRLLSKHGRLIIRDNAKPNALSYWWANFVRLPIYNNLVRGGGDVHYYTPREMKRLSSKHGLNMISCEIFWGRKLHCVISKEIK